ncbi:MAG: cell division protein FtsZ, partial [Firmicutes bacterium]|nr:cell division protein FtsZ [Bacillota bacterium]
TVNEDLDDEFIVTVIATGYELKAKDSTIENLASEIFNKTSDEQMKLTRSGLKSVDDDMDNEDDNMPKEGKQRNLPSWLTKKGKF